MNINDKISNSVSSIFGWLLLLMICGCAGEDHYLLIEDIVYEEDGEKMITLNFTAEVNYTDSHYTDITSEDIETSMLYNSTDLNFENLSDLNQTKLPYVSYNIPLPIGRYIHIYVYKYGSTPLNSAPLKFGLYKCVSEGVISPTSSQYAITLAPGRYNFYALSELNNDSDKTPSFVNSTGYGGVKTGLSNGLDYLWWSSTGVRVTGTSSPDLSILFKQISSQIQLNFIASSGTTFTFSTQNIQAPSTTSCRLQMATGKITTSTIFSSGMQNLELVDNYSMYINIVPFKPSTNIYAKIAMNINNKGNSWQTITLKTPVSGNFYQGYSYVYNVYVDGTKITKEPELTRIVPIVNMWK